MTAYHQLETRFRRIGAIEGAISMLHWDAAAMMPAGGAAARAEQLASLRLIAHQHLTTPDIGDLLADAEDECDELDEWQRANLREMRRRRVHAAALPDTLVEAESRACSECEAVWRTARAQNDFAAVLPLLERVLRLECEIAATNVPGRAAACTRRRRISRKLARCHRSSTSLSLSASPKRSPISGTVSCSCTISRKVASCSARASAPPAGIIAAASQWSIEIAPSIAPSRRNRVSS